MIRALPVTFAVLLFAGSAHAETDQNGTPEQKDAQPHATGKPVTTMKIKRCPDGYEIVTLVNGQRACAKDIVPVNE
jgi:hypothetical protein